MLSLALPLSIVSDDCIIDKSFGLYISTEAGNRENK
jgi:hypothetical protein